jgi:hypothetical protein
LISNGDPSCQTFQRAGKQGRSAARGRMREVYLNFEKPEHTSLLRRLPATAVGDNSNLKVLSQTDDVLGEIFAKAATRKSSLQDATDLRLVVHHEDGYVGHRYASACRNVEKGNKGLVALNTAFADGTEGAIKIP